MSDIFERFVLRITPPRNCMPPQMKWIYQVSGIIRTAAMRSLLCVGNVDRVNPLERATSQSSAFEFAKYIKWGTPVTLKYLDTLL